MGTPRGAEDDADEKGLPKLHTVACAFSDQYHTASALHPLITHLERAVGYEVNDPIYRRLDKMEVRHQQIVSSH
jgi:hypothetical protein